MERSLLEKLEEIDEHGQDLTPWEVGFVADMLKRELTFGSAKQAALVDRIYEEKVPEEWR